MSYFTLTPNQGHLIGELSVNPGLQAKAESWATLRIDEAFFAWDRTVWTGALIPVQISDIAEKLTTGKYLELCYSRGNPKIDADTLSQRLLKEGEAAILRVLDAGGPIDPTYTNYIQPPAYSRQAGRNVRIQRG